MEANVNVNIRMNPELKKQFEAFCKDMGLTMTTAINLFVKKTVREYRIPFEIGAEQPNQETLEAINEISYLKAHPNEGKSYTSAKELRRDILGDV